MDPKDSALKTAKNEYTHYHLRSETICALLALSILKIENYQQISNDIMKSQGKKNTPAKQKQKNKKQTNIILKLESCELIPYVVDLTGLIIFSRNIYKRKSRH